ncbi:MAG: radical SAM protein [Firmicutes bacterium]|nr:radical SAM protein [Bacillota bacterium]
MRETKSGLYQLEIELTDRCNMNCSHCYMGHQRKNIDIDSELVYRILREAHELDVSDIIFSGGEPLLNKDVYQFAAFVKKNQLNLSVGLLTNGLLLRDSFDDGQLTLFDFVQFSLDFPFGGTGFHHNNFFKTMELACRVKQAGIYVSFLATIDRTNYQFIEKLAEAVMPFEMQLGFNYLCPQGNASQLQDRALSSEQLMESFRAIYRLKQKYNKEYDLINSGNPLQVLAEEEKQKAAAGQTRIIGGCTAGITTMTLDVEGNVLACPFLRVSEDNITHHSLRDIWYHSQMFARLRDRKNLKGKCKICQYKYICGGCRTSAYLSKNDWLDEDPNCFLEAQHGFTS